LVHPSRTRTNLRRYSQEDIEPCYYWRKKCIWIWMMFSRSC
jgi:hypothetical protein